MAILLRPSDVAGSLTYTQVMDALLAGFTAEAEGRVQAPSRLTTPTPSGWIRIMPAVINGSGPEAYMGCKVMNLVKGKGVRYLILLYSTITGELLALMDAAQVTQMRTAGTAALAARHMLNGEFPVLGMVGSGYEARGLLDAMAQTFSFSQVVVYSPHRENREAFAREMSERVRVQVVPVDEANDVLRRTPVVVLATKSTEPVIDGEYVREGATLLSIGSTRLDLRELDLRSIERAHRLVVDSAPQVKIESGDITAALDAGVLRDEQIVPLADLVRGRVRLRQRSGDIVVLKTVGTALQDLVTAGRVHEFARERGLGIEIGDWPQLKPFA